MPRESSGDATAATAAAATATTATTATTADVATGAATLTARPTSPISLPVTRASCLDLAPVPRSRPASPSPSPMAARRAHCTLEARAAPAVNSCVGFD